MLRLVSSYSIAEGSRGYPQIVEVLGPGQGSSVRLVVARRPVHHRAAEHHYHVAAIRTAAHRCRPSRWGTHPSWNWAGRSLPPRRCVEVRTYWRNARLLPFSTYRPYNPIGLSETPAWLPLWDKPFYRQPEVHIEMRAAAPNAASLSVLGVTVPVR